MKSRRDFLKTAPAVFSALPVFATNASAQRRDIERAKELLDPGMNLVRDGQVYAKRNKKTNTIPVLREEILDNPNAVFIIRTSVQSKKDESGKFPAEREQFQRAGFDCASKMFRKGTVTGGTTYIKPNFVGGFDADERRLNNGVSTHPSFVAGFSDALKEMENTNIVVGANGAAQHEHFVQSGICEMMHERGVCFTEGKYKSYDDYIKSEITWVDYPDGVVMRRVPFFRLTTEKDTLLINMAKDRIHQLGFTTLTIKNLQGIMPVGYMHICGGWSSTLNRGSAKNVFNPDYRQTIERGYIRHANMNYKYWDEGGYTRAYYKAGGWDAFRQGRFTPDYRVFWGEQWGQRMMDVNSCITPHVNLVEGIVGVDGANTLHLNNFIAISKNRVSCDAMSAWLMGHDPRELPFLRIAKERGLGDNDIDKLAVYEITGRGVERVGDYRTLPRARMGVWVYTTKGAPLRYF